MKILKLLAQRPSAKDIGRRLAISPRTVEFHENRTMASLGLHTRAQLVSWAIHQGIVRV